MTKRSQTLGGAAKKKRSRLYATRAATRATFVCRRYDAHALAEANERAQASLSPSHAAKARTAGERKRIVVKAASGGQRAASDARQRQNCGRLSDASSTRTPATLGVCRRGRFYSKKIRIFGCATFSGGV